MATFKGIYKTDNLPLVNLTPSSNKLADIGLLTERLYDL